MRVKLAVLKSKSSPVEKSQSLKFQRTKSDHGVESVLVATEKKTVVNVQHAKINRSLEDLEKGIKHAGSVSARG